MIFAVSGIQILLGLLSAISFILLAYYCFSVILLMIREVSKGQLLFFWEFEKYRQDTILNIKKRTLKAILSLLTLLISIFFVHLVDKIKN